MDKGTYKGVGQELRMFSRKLEAQLRYQNVPYDWEFKTIASGDEVNKRSGTRFIPLLRTPDGWVINDTISIGPFLNDRFIDCPVIPTSPALRCSCFILEDFFNHWYPRHALHSRWCYSNNIDVIGERFGKNSILNKSIETPISDEESEQIKDFGELMLNSFGAKACEIQGAGPEHSASMKKDFTNLLDLLLSHLEHHDFLLGNRACLADFALVGPFKGHFLLDPEPISWLGGNLGAVESYVDRVWQHGSDTQNYFSDDYLPETLNPLFEYVEHMYQKFAEWSINAALNDKKFFTLDLGYGPFEARSMKRLEKARLHVQDEILKTNYKNSPIGNKSILNFFLKDSLA